jgi:adenine phosphoribosyltransferase
VNCLADFRAAAIRLSLSGTPRRPQQREDGGDMTVPLNRPAPLSREFSPGLPGPAIMSEPAVLRLRDFIREIPDFPKPGIQFKDITPLLAEPEPFAMAIDRLADHYRHQQVDLVVAAEARGFIFATPLAMALRVGFVPIRKPGKLPYQRHSHTYELEYGTDTLEMHIDSIRPGQRVLVVDDLLATGGTVSACCEMIEKCEAIVAGCAFLIELTFLNGARRLAPRPVFSLIQYDE